MLLLEVLGLQRGSEKRRYYRDLRLGLLLILAVLFSVSGLGRRQPSMLWMAIGSASLLIAAVCLYYSGNRKAILAGLFGFVALRGFVGFFFFQSYSGLALALISLLIVFVLLWWNQNRTNFLRAGRRHR